MQTFRFLLSFFLLTFTLFGVDAKLTIEKDVEQRARIAIVDASGVSARQVYRLFLSDLKISGHFLPSGEYKKGSFDTSVPPSDKKEEYLLKYTYENFSGSVLQVILIRTADKKEVFRKRYAVKRSAKMPFLVHKAVYDINAFLHYPDIGWINRYVLYSRYIAPRKTEIGVADYTFTYQKSIIRGGLNIFPKWADARQRAFYYTSLRGTLPALYRLNIYSGARSRIVASQGMIVCSDVGKGGNKLLLTMAPEGQPDIYEYDVRNGTKRRLTRFNGIDVGAHYAKNGQMMVFVSNRLGYANIFKKRIGGSAVTPVVYRGRNNNACDAFGDKIVYASRESDSPFRGNRFNIYLTDVYGSDTRPLTTTGSNQFPRFSNDGNIVMFMKQTADGTYMGYINLESRQSLLFPLGGKLQSVDW
jgi:TolB protein